MKKTKPLIYIAIAGVPLFCVILWIAFMGPQHWFMVSRYWGKRQPIQFDGQVVDQQGKPISGATVSIILHDFDSSSIFVRNTTNLMIQKPITRISDSAGRFSLENIVGISIHIEKVICEGYIAIPEREWRGRSRNLGFFGYERERGVPFYIPDEKAPAIFPLRREGEERILWPSRGGKDEPNTSSLPATKGST